MEATALLKSAGQQLGKWMVEESKYLYAVKDKVEGLQRELEWIQCFLRNADERKGDDEMIRKWISEINDFSYEAEDILEKYLVQVSHPRKKDGIWNMLKWLTYVLGDAISTREAGTEIDALTSKISMLTTRMITYGVKPASSSSSMVELRRTHSHILVDDIVGLKKGTNVVLDYLMNKETKVIAISGMGGSGKTTLAWKVYHAVKKEHQFEMCAWVYVSQKFQPSEVLREILLNFYADDETKMNSIPSEGSRLEKVLCNILKDKKCLVVLDDLWKFDHWNLLEKAFPKPTMSSSKLLITTRSNDLVNQIDPQGILHKHKGLDNSEGFQLFYKKANLAQYTKTKDHEEEKLFKKKKILGKQLVAKCNGLPLAIVVLGGLLASKKTLEEWENVHKNVETFLSGENDAEIGVPKVLELSYTDLPYHLRPCFLHLGNFPEGLDILTKKLYRMWIAEGIVAPKNGKPVNLEDTAKSYLKELAQRCIVQVKTGPEGKIKSCRLHGSMLKMCISKAKEENFLSVVCQENMNVGYDSGSAIRDGNLHRVSIHFGQNLQNSFDQASHLRSLMFFTGGPIRNGNQGWLKTMIKNFKLLRVLDLETTGIEEIPKVLGNLFLLRYLSIKGTHVRKLPSTISNLRCLQTLDLRVHLPDDCVMRIPHALWKMKRLKHLYLPSHAYKVNSFKKLRVKGLSNLEILKNLDTRRSQVSDLCKLAKLRKLSIKNEVSTIETLKVIIECQSIRNKSLVHLSLNIHGALLNEESTILSSCTCLHTLNVTGSKMMTKLNLASVEFPENLTILAINSCKLMCKNPMQTFKQLCKLRILSLDEVSFSENCMDCTQGGFLQLVVLKLSNMKNLREWRVGEYAMPQLQSLQIYNCKNLQIPDKLPKTVEVVCNPCVNGIDKYLTCPFHKVALKDDDDDDLATRQCKEYHS